MNAGRLEIGDQAADTDAADLLVVGERDMQRPPEPAPRELGRESECDGDETFHVGAAAAV